MQSSSKSRRDPRHFWGSSMKRVMWWISHTMPSLVKITLLLAWLWTAVATQKCTSQICSERLSTFLRSRVLDWKDLFSSLYFPQNGTVWQLTIEASSDSCPGCSACCPRMQVSKSSITGVVRVWCDLDVALQATHPRNICREIRQTGVIIMMMISITIHHFPHPHRHLHCHYQHYFLCHPYYYIPLAFLPDPCPVWFTVFRESSTAILQELVIVPCWPFLDPFFKVDST